MRFKRNQVEEAVWRWMSRGNSGGEPPPVFRTRVKRLLEIDRAEPPYPPPAAAMAFAAEAPAGRGHEAGFGGFDVFCLALGLLLLNAGFKQREIVHLLRHVRPRLVPEWERLDRDPVAPRQYVAAGDRPDAPSRWRNGILLADTDVYLVLDRIETTEIFPAAPQDRGLILEPQLLRGGAALLDRLSDYAHDFPGHYVVELSNMAALLRHYLADAEPRRRGPG